MSTLRQDSDLATALGGLCHRIDRAAWALKGMTLESPEQGDLQALAEELEDVAAHFDYLRLGLCSTCRGVEVVMEVRSGGKAGRR
jgi:hypothetical protein